MVKTPITYFGGKGNFVKKLLPLLPPHHIYCEVFGGGAALLFAKEPSPVEVYNDIDGDLVNFFRVLRDPEKFQQFLLKVQLTPYSREEFNFCRETYRDCTDPVERAYRWYIVARQCFSGDVRSSAWAYSVRASDRGMSSHTNKYLAAIERLPEFHMRVMRVQIEHDDFRKVIARYDTSDTLFYLDPPYVPETRKGGTYKHEMSLEDHADLVQQILRVRGMVILSGYRHAVYEPLERAGWGRRDYETACYVSGRTRKTNILGAGAAKAKQPRVESVWISPRVQERLMGQGLFGETPCRQG